MSIFGIIEVDQIVQENEKTRVDATKSFITQDEAVISEVEIEPFAGSGFVSVFGSSAATYFLDWVYATAGVKTVSLRITTDGAPVTFTKTLTAVTAVADALFATDEDLKNIEPEILKWVPRGKSTWNFVHRKVQDKILTEIYKNRILDNESDKLTKADVVDTAEVREWATYMALSMIFSGISNSTDDVFSAKATKYAKLEKEYMNYSLNILHLDYDGDGLLEDSEKLDFRSGRMVRG